jgi:hypothetical protein
MADALRLLLPVYQGPGLRLFRRESFFNRRRRSHGLSWSDDSEVARSYAESGVCRTANGGSILLAAMRPRRRSSARTRFVLTCANSSSIAGA